MRFHRKVIDDFPGVQHFIFSIDFDQPLSFDSPEDLYKSLFSGGDVFLKIGRSPEMSRGARVDREIDFRKAVQFRAIAAADIFFFSLRSHECLKNPVNKSKMHLLKYGFCCIIFSLKRKNSTFIKKKRCKKWQKLFW